MAAERRPFNPALRLGWQGLGADFSGGTEKPSREVVALCGEGAPLLLSVSTLEPRKGYPIALDAFDKLWREGVDVRYVIVGREGWMVSALKQRIFSHPEYRRRLFWLSNASDADLRHLYGCAHSLVFATIAEGFGLALVEAAYYGLPAIVTDIPVFREIAGDSVALFRSWRQRHAGATDTRLLGGAEDAARDPLDELGRSDGQAARDDRGRSLSIWRAAREDRRDRAGRGAAFLREAARVHSITAS